MAKPLLVALAILALAALVVLRFVSGEPETRSFVAADGREPTGGSERGSEQVTPLPERPMSPRTGGAADLDAGLREGELISEALHGSEAVNGPSITRPAPTVDSATLTGRAPEGDPYETRRLELVVVDAEGRPVPAAQVSIRGLRSALDPGSWIGYRGVRPTAMTGADGRVALDYWAWATPFGRTKALDLWIDHPAFVPLRDAAFDPNEPTAVLQRGPTLVVSAWIESPGELEANIAIEMERAAHLPADAWTLEADGRRSTNRLAPGKHLIWIEHKCSEHGARFSEITTFELEDGVYQELHLGLLSAERLTGALDADVPRPIVDGRVRLTLLRHDDEGRLALHRDFEASIAADGSFAFERLPRGDAELFAACRGWAIGQASRRQLPSTSIPGAPVVLPMERTGTVDVAVRLADGSPVPDVTVVVGPNVCSPVGCSLVPWREWSTRTDRDGHARVEDVPAQAGVPIGALARDFMQRRSDTVAVEVRPGETAQAELVVEPRSR